ncbi:monoheme cytochrome C [Pareuzebyella sediminis]|uniref:monoheme cytochrome C n=1 Tax=Pareuzebyella sediminis TaxID=2607998 RepID=UPI0011EDAB26|nr:monoheme cytochrome C [Pareuzebyella sediminis]
MPDHKSFWKNSRKAYRFLIVLCGVAFIAAILVFYIKGDKVDDNYEDVVEKDPNRIENGIHVRTGLIDAPGLTETVNNCTTCHSAKLVIQNRMSKARWQATIRWMQETQNLWDLGDQEDIIVNYLVTNYPPQKKGRRQSLSDVEWYTLK